MRTWLCSTMRRSSRGSRIFEGWERDGDTITKTFKRGDFVGPVEFVRKLVEPARTWATTPICRCPGTRSGHDHYPCRRRPDGERLRAGEADRRAQQLASACGSSTSSGRARTRQDGARDRGAAARLPDGRHAIVHTGQHYDRLMSEVFLDELGSPPRTTCSGRVRHHGEQTARVIERLEPVLAERTSPTFVLVPGDATRRSPPRSPRRSWRSGSGHVESGLRSFDRSMPEEINRVVTDQLSDLLFMHSRTPPENLRREGIRDERMHFVGNTMIDTLVSLEAAFQVRRCAAALGLRRGQYLLVTLHRRALRRRPAARDAMKLWPRSGASCPSCSRSTRGRERCSAATTEHPGSRSPTRSGTSTSYRSRRTRRGAHRTRAGSRRRPPPRVPASPCGRTLSAR